MNSKSKNKNMQLANLLAVFKDGTVVPLDATKLTIIDKNTGKPLFKQEEK